MDIFKKCYNFTEAREAQAAGYYPYFMPISESCDTEVTIHGERKIMIGSNNYLGLTHDPRILEAAEQAGRKYGSGCTGSRFLNGTLDLHEELEQELADFVGKEAALIFSTGYQTNLGTIASLVGRGDTVFTDRLNHACIIDGCQMSFGEVVRFRHQDYENLEQRLSKSDPERGKLIVVDGIFSMEGDIADLQTLTKLCEKFGCRLMIDDAHSLGVLGSELACSAGTTGAGTAEHFGLTDQVDLIMGTFSKSFACIGGFIASEEAVIDYLKHHARSLIFSASMPPSAVATVHAALNIIRSEPERREQLWKNTYKMHEGFRALGFNIGITETPIVPIIIGDTMKTFYFWKQLFIHGLFTNPVVSPAVPEHSSRLRTSFMATHTGEQLDRVLEIFERVGKECGVI